MTAALATPHATAVPPDIPDERVDHLEPTSPAYTSPSASKWAAKTAEATAGAKPGHHPTGHSRPRLHVSPRHVAAMHYYASLLVAVARALLADAARPSGDRELIIDLSQVPAGPYCAELVFLIGLLRRALGPVRLRLVGVSPAVAAPLVGGGLGADVLVVDSRGRTWPGEPDRPRPIGTYP